MTKRRWTAEELNYLEQAWGKVSVPRIAKRLDRTISSLKHRATILGLGGYKNNSDLITFASLMACFGNYNRRAACRNRFTKAGLNIYEKLLAKRRIYFVSIPEFWAWAESHRDMLNFYKLEPLILGVEPAWVAEQRKIDYYGKIEARRVWAEKDDKMLRYLLAKDCSVSTIAQRLNRTEAAIFSRCYEKGLFYPRKCTKRPWTVKDKKLLWDMRKAGYPFKIIAERIGRSATSCRCAICGMKKERKTTAWGI